jgi:hypothetical protein
MDARDATALTGVVGAWLDAYELRQAEAQDARIAEIEARLGQSPRWDKLTPLPAAQPSEPPDVGEDPAGWLGCAEPDGPPPHRNGLIELPDEVQPLWDG